MSARAWKDGHGVGEAGGAAAGSPPDVAAGRVEPEPPPASRAPGPPPAIRPSDRACAIGMTGSGKSKLLAQLWAIYPGQRLLVDVTDACELGPAALQDPGGYCLAESVREIDWRKRTIHVVPRAQSDAFYNDLYAAVFDRGQMCVLLDESQGPTAPNRAPRWLRSTITQGRKRNILHLAATQEPMNVLPVIYSQAEHLFLFQLTGRPDELRALSPRFRLSADELAAELDELLHRHGPHGYLRVSSRERLVRRMPPLPAEVIAHVEQHLRFVA